MDLSNEVAGDPRPVFLAMFEAVRHYLLTDGLSEEAQGIVALNPMGEATRGFDLTAERIALDLAHEGLGSFRAFSEEAGAITVGSGEPRWILVLDPCDGSSNYRRGIRSVGFAVAALPAGAPLDPDRVQYALCGDIFTGAVYAATRGQGATLDGSPIATSNLVDPHLATLGVNLGHDGSEKPDVIVKRDEGSQTNAAKANSSAYVEGIWRVLRTAATVRRSGASVLDLSYVAHGAYDAYVDLRCRLTPENFLAPALILKEAGGVFTDARGEPLGAVAFTTPYSVLAAGNRVLLDAILRVLA